MKKINLITLFTLLMLSSCISKSEFDQYHTPYYDTPWDFSITSMSATANSVNLTWENSHNARTYTVKYKDSSDSTFTISSANATSPYTVNGLSVGHLYYFKIEAVGVSASTESKTKLLHLTNPPVASAMSLSMNVGATQTITLSYTDSESDQASSCSLDPTSISGLIITSSCSCSAGVCQVGVKETLGTPGNAHFQFTVTANFQTSSSALVDISVLP
jgi:hypothetical protein